MSEPVDLRPVISDADFEAFFRLRCDPENIRSSGHTSPPSREGLRAWLDREVASGNRLIFVIWQGVEPVGYLYAHRRDFGIEEVIDITQACRGRGIGPRALAQIPEQFAKFDGWPPPYIAWIRTDNFSSFRAHERAGFRPDIPEQFRHLDGARWARRVWTA